MSTLSFSFIVVPCNNNGSSTAMGAIKIQKCLKKKEKKKLLVEKVWKLYYRIKITVWLITVSIPLKGTHLPLCYSKPSTLENNITFVNLHREKMGSHLMVETSRNPDCPKVSLMRWSDSLFPQRVFCLTLFTCILLRNLLSPYPSLYCSAWQIKIGSKAIRKWA